MHFIVQPSTAVPLETLVCLCPLFFFFLFFCFFFTAFVFSATHSETQEPWHTSCDLTFGPLVTSVAKGDTVKSQVCPRKEDRSRPSAGLAEAVLWSALSPLLLRASWQEDRPAGFLILTLLCFISFDSGWIDYWRGCLLGLKPYARKADLDVHRSAMVGRQCQLSQSSAACFIFRCQGNNTQR